MADKNHTCESLKASETYATSSLDNAKYGSDVLLLHLVGDDTFPLDMNSGSTDTDHHPKDHTSIPLTLPHASAPSSRKVSTHKHAKSKSSPKCHSPSFATRSIEAQPISFVGSDAEVNSYLGSRFQRLQQLATKKLVKAWIKGICPNKQALFPYQSNKTGKGPRSLPNTPGWWPQQDGVCRFRAPDHLRRAERTRLCMHILRLRPTPQHLASWNSSTTEHNKVHASSGWTEFLRSLAGPNIFDDLTDQRSDKLKLRRALLSEIYSIAALEEQFCTRRVIEGSGVNKEGPKVAHQRVLKRARRTSAASNTSQEYGHSPSLVEKHTKKMKKAPGL